MVDKPNLIILYEQLGSIKGYYNEAYDYKFIHINVRLDDAQKRTVTDEILNLISDKNKFFVFL